MAVLLALVSLVVLGWAQPHTRYAYRSVLFTVKNVEVFYLAEEGVFMQAGSRTFILDKLSRRENSFERIFLFDYRGPAGAEAVTASDGALVEVPSDPRPILRLNAGHRLRLARWPQLEGDEPPPPATVSDFTTVDTPLGRLSSTVFRPRGEDQRELTLPELWRELWEAKTEVPAAAVRAEFHRRVVSIATVLVLPVLALPFALGRRRGQRAYRFGIALVIVIAYHEMIEQGAVASRVNDVSPWLSMWLPFLVLVVFAAWRYHAACFRLRPDRLEPLIERANDVLRGLARRLGRHVGWGEA
jgi:lipopolysaccharide export system permease protein